MVSDFFLDASDKVLHEGKRPRSLLCIHIPSITAAFWKNSHQSSVSIKKNQALYVSYS